MYIVVEGLDLSGKSTLINKLSEIYKSRKVSEPFNETLIGSKVRNVVCNGELNNLYKTHLLIANRVELFKKLSHYTKPNSPAYLLSDRNFLSSMVYQSQYPKDIERIMWQNVNTLKTYGFDILPNILIYIDVPYTIAQQRLQSRQHANSLDHKVINKKTYSEMQEKYQRGIELIASNFEKTKIIKFNYNDELNNLVYMIDEIAKSIDSIPVKKL